MIHPNDPFKDKRTSFPGLRRLFDTRSGKGRNDRPYTTSSTFLRNRYWCSRLQWGTVSSFRQPVSGGWTGGGGENTPLRPQSQGPQRQYTPTPGVASDVGPREPRRVDDPEVGRPPSEHTDFPYFPPRVRTFLEGPETLLRRTRVFSLRTAQTVVYNPLSSTKFDPGLGNTPISSRKDPKCPTRFPQEGSGTTGCRRS